MSKVSVRTDRGVVVGSARAGMRTFLGIPYAAPPVGELRWRPGDASPRPATRAARACYSLDDEEYLEPDLTSTVRTHPAGDVCASWDDVERRGP